MNELESELAVVCQGIIEDGELTEHEVHYLAEWLTAVPAASETEIGRRLTEALNLILADGVIDEQELHTLAPIIGEAACLAPPPLETQNAIEASSPRVGLVAGVKNWLAARKEKREREEMVRREVQRARIQQRHQNIAEIVRRLQTGEGFLEHTSSFVTRGAEQICWVEPGVLHEVKVVGRRYEGGSRSTRIRVAKGLSFSIGGSRGYSVSERGVVPTSQGQLIITTQRLAFVGDSKSIAVKLEKLIDVQNALDGMQFSESGKEHPKMIKFHNPNGDIVVAVMNFVLNNQGTRSS